MKKIINTIKFHWWKMLGWKYVVGSDFADDFEDNSCLTIWRIKGDKRIVQDVIYSTPLSSSENDLEKGLGLTEK